MIAEKTRRPISAFMLSGHARRTAAAQSQCAGRGDSLRNQVDESPIFIVGHGQDDAPRWSRPSSVMLRVRPLLMMPTSSAYRRGSTRLLTRTVISMLLILDRLSRLVQFDGQQSVAMPVFVDGARSIRPRFSRYFLTPFFEVGNRHGLRLCFPDEKPGYFRTQ